MQIKKELRAAFSEKRIMITDKTEKDNAICSAFLNSDIYNSADEILCYCSFGSEIDTSKIIENCLRGVYNEGYRAAYRVPVRRVFLFVSQPKNEKE